MTPRERSEQVPWSERGMKTIPQPLDLPRDVHPAPGPSQAPPCPPWASLGRLYAFVAGEALTVALARPGAAPRCTAACRGAGASAWAVMVAVRGQGRAP